jgi:hypothetical protein
METLDDIHQHKWEAAPDPRLWLESSKHTKSHNRIPQEVLEFFHREHGDTLHPSEVRRALRKGFTVSTNTFAPARIVIRLPGVMIVFYVLGFAITFIFATLLALSAAGSNLVHPLISLLGLVGGLTWLSTAWTDLVLWKREKLSVQSTRETGTETAKTLTAQGC